MTSLMGELCLYVIPSQESYSSADNKGAFDCVVTCFFIDTAHSIADYLEVINHCLRPEGIWINLGPLLWHWCVGVISFFSDEMSM